MAHDSTNCPICRGQPFGGSMSDETFFEFLNHCHAELEVKQAKFQQRISTAPNWRYELNDRTLTVGDKRFGMTPIGTFSPEYQTWLWAWANDDYPESAKSAARLIQGLFDVTGFQVFRDPGIEASSSDAQDFVALAVHQLGAIGFFRCPSQGPTLHLAVFEELKSP